jgi:hypothetical protein
MRIFILLLVTIAVFIGCAVIGFQIAQTVGGPGVDPNGPAPVISPGQEQHNFMLVRADDLGSGKPELVSVWFVSLYFTKDTPTPSLLSLAQIYPPKAASPKSNSLVREFTLTPEGEPQPAFWDAVRRYELSWEGYLLFDTEGANQFLQWLVGPSDFHKALEDAPKSADKSRIMAEQICRSIADSTGKPISDFNWNQVVPRHFRTNLGLEAGLSYWDWMTNTGHPVRCEFLPRP